tara:strand:+ start:9256 stop:9390 length:135 start_codon:yes stop_codon:yes gene_type:complete
MHITASSSAEVIRIVDKEARTKQAVIQFLVHACSIAVNSFISWG